MIIKLQTAMSTNGLIDAQSEAARLLVKKQKERLKFRKASAGAGGKGKETKGGT